MLVGIDDTDSLEGGCTTHLASLLVDRLGPLGDIDTNESTDLPEGWVEHQLPHLVRLNPNIPYKTRGNAAISFWVPDDIADKTRELVFKFISGQARLDDENTNPGIAFMRDYSKLSLLRNLYERAVSEYVTIEEADKVADKAGVEIYGFNNGRGVIGALAAIGANLQGDKTYELVAYRERKNHGREREIDAESVHLMNEKMFPQTFNNIDPETKQILITPKGSDPVYCGIRGETTEAVEKAWKMINPLEDIERTQVFVSNQATDAHLREKKIHQIKPYDCVIAEGLVEREPWTIEGGHVLITLTNGDDAIDCAAYEPTGNLRKAVKELITGDRIKIYGGVGRYKKTINIEKLEVLKLKEKTRVTAPICCNKRMSSAGKGKGYKCRKCGRRVGVEAAVEEEMDREIRVGFYEVPPRARRHLSKPLHRMRQIKG